MSAVTSVHEDDLASGRPGGETLQPTRWRDRKRYAWLLGLIVPLLPFISWGLVQATGLGVFWFYGPVLIFGVFPLLDLLVGLDASNPPDSVIKWLEQDRYYRWCTYLFLPLQYAGLVFACWMWSHGGLSVLDIARLGADGRDGRGRRDQHRARARPQARELRALAQPRRAGADRLRTLLHRAQPRPPRARGHARGSRQRAHGRELLRLLAAHRLRQPALGLGARAHRAWQRMESRTVDDPQRHR